MKTARSIKRKEDGKWFKYGVGHLTSVIDSTFVGTIVRRAKTPDGELMYELVDHEGTQTLWAPEGRITIINTDQPPAGGFKYAIGEKVETPGAGLYATIDNRAVSPSGEIWYRLVDTRSKAPFLMREEAIQLL